ncbi:MAG: hypothetical protein IJT25_01720 [Clostridia bacterium]|nr:hypothetical protein [Clostridia bacterium]
MIFKILGLSLITIISSTIVRQKNEEIGSLLSLAGGLMISLLIINEAKDLINNFVNFEYSLDIYSDYISPALKILGIAYLTEMASDLAEDSKNKYLSNKIILGGKICLLSISIKPIIKVFEMLMGLL